MALDVSHDFEHTVVHWDKPEEMTFYILVKGLYNQVFDDLDYHFHIRTDVMKDNIEDTVKFLAPDVYADIEKEVDWRTHKHLEEMLGED